MSRHFFINTKEKSHVYIKKNNHNRSFGSHTWWPSCWQMGRAFSFKNSVKNHCNASWCSFNNPCINCFHNNDYKLRYQPCKN